MLALDSAATRQPSHSLPGTGGWDGDRGTPRAAVAEPILPAANPGQGFLDTLSPWGKSPTPGAEGRSEVAPKGPTRWPCISGVGPESTRNAVGAFKVLFTPSLPQGPGTVRGPLCPTAPGHPTALGLPTAPVCRASEEKSGSERSCQAWVPPPGDACRCCQTRLQTSVWSGLASQPWGRRPPHSGTPGEALPAHLAQPLAHEVLPAVLGGRLRDEQPVGPRGQGGHQGQVPGGGGTTRSGPGSL